MNNSSRVFVFIENDEQWEYVQKKPEKYHVDILAALNCVLLNVFLYKVVLDFDWRNYIHQVCKLESNVHVQDGTIFMTLTILLIQKIKVCFIIILFFYIWWFIPCFDWNLWCPKILPDHSYIYLFLFLRYINV